MIFTDDTFNKLRFLAERGIPALATLVGTIMVALGRDATGVVTIITAVGAFIGTLVGISRSNYTMNQATPEKEDDNHE